MGKLVSVIVPVYNVKPYLKRCLDSILQQDYDNLEIILVDDGSTDGSGAMCDAYADGYKVRVLHQKNQGVSVARNMALDQARGEYVLFVDSDDYIARETLSTTVSVMEQEQADLVIFKFYMMTGDGLIPSQQRVNGQSVDVRSLDTKTTIELAMMDTIISYTWNKLYRRSLWEKVRFPVGYCYEDLFVHPQLLLRVKKAVYIPQNLYFYNRINVNSITALLGGEFKAFNHYCRFRAYREHERVAKIIQRADMKRWAIFKATKTGIKAFYINTQNKGKLKDCEKNDIKDYLREHDDDVLMSELGLKYRSLRWSALHMPVWCSCYGWLRWKQEQIRMLLHR